MPINYERDHLFATPGPSTTAHSGKGKGQGDKATVRTPGLDHQRLSLDWADVDAVRGGTRAMRDLGPAYLPEEPGEDPDAYARRLNRATLTPSTPAWCGRLSLRCSASRCGSTTQAG